MNIKKRFWTEVAVIEVESGFEVNLDGKQLKTPAKACLILPNRNVAELVAKEWDAQEGEIDPDQMPATRLSNSVIDKVSVNQGAIVDMLAEYGGSDLLCYRATGPEELIKRQAHAWDPILEWANCIYGSLSITEGVMHIDQPEKTLRNFKLELGKFSAWELAAMHELITISGSLVLAFAVARDHISSTQAWDLSRIDEDWQKEKWGGDEEAEGIAFKKAEALKFAAKFLNFVKC